MAFIVEPQVEEYAEAYTTPDGDLFERLAEETRAKTTAPQMMVGRIEGRFLATLVALSGARRILEFGTFTGYSSISMASALPADGKVITLDVDPEATAIARRYMDESGHGDKIEIRLGPALETLQDVEGPFDLIFIDADKPNYVNYYEAALPLLADDGLVIADNVLWSGRVVEDDGDESTRAIKEFNEHVRADDRVVSVMLTVRDGMTLIRKAAESFPEPCKNRPILLVSRGLIFCDLRGGLRPGCIGACLRWPRRCSSSCSPGRLQASARPPRAGALDGSRPRCSTRLPSAAVRPSGSS